MRNPRVTITITPQMRDALEELLSHGLHGRTLSEVCNRLICGGLLARIEAGEINLPGRRPITSPRRVDPTIYGPGVL